MALRVDDVAKPRTPTAGSSPAALPPELEVPVAAEQSGAVLSVHGVRKSFGPTKALIDCSFDLARGEVLVLMGENGSGKSTLVKILSGVQSADAGEITVAGADARRLRSPRAARKAGIATVFQEVLTVETQSVLENIWLGSDGIFVAHVSRREKRKRAEEALTELLGRPIDVDTPIAALSLSDRQACAIVRALFAEPKVLILDEATSALDVATRDRLLEAVRRLSKDGVSTIFISHRIDEIQSIGDRVAVLRSGRIVEIFEGGDWTTASLVHAMSGAEHATQNIRSERLAGERGDVVLRTEGLRLTADSEPIDIEIHAGELIGVAGLEGHGQEQFLLALAGNRKAAAGKVVAVENGQDFEVVGSTDGEHRGIAYVPRDRRSASLFGWMSIRDNFAISSLAKDTSFGFISRRRSDRRLEDWKQQLSIKYGAPGDAITTLSGGNQQKVVLARWLATEPRVLLLNDPTRGIDINAKRDLYTFAVELANQGLAVVMLSTEVDEHVELMDRVWVFREMNLFDEISGNQLTRENLVGSYFGQKAAQ